MTGGLGFSDRQTTTYYTLYKGMAVSSSAEDPVLLPPNNRTGSRERAALNKDLKMLNLQIE
jgi:hypothetical protein